MNVRYVDISLCVYISFHLYHRVEKYDSFSLKNSDNTEGTTVCIGCIATMEIFTTGQV